MGAAASVHVDNFFFLCQFLGLCSYYRQFIPNFTEIAEPLQSLTRKDTIWTWLKPQQQTFNELKKQLTETPVLALPVTGGQYILQTDASDIAIRAVLSQIQKDGFEHPIAYASRTLSKAERNYMTTKKECLAVVFWTKQFRLYLWGQHFIVETDHSAL